MRTIVTSSILSRDPRFKLPQIPADAPLRINWTQLGLLLMERPVTGAIFRKIETVVSDLDNTLVDSHEAFHILNLEIGRRLGAHNAVTLKVMHDAMRGRPLPDYLQEFHRACANQVGGLAFDTFFSTRATTLADGESGKLTLDVPQIPDAYHLIGALRIGLNKQILVSTHCPRGMACTFIRSTGFDAFISEGELVCGDDSTLGKDSADYWKALLAGRNPDECLGIDDTPHGARWMLEVAKLGYVIVRPSSPRYITDLRILQRDYADRLFLVDEFVELFHG